MNMFDFLTEQSEKKKKERNKLLMLVGGETGSGKSHLLNTAPEGQKWAHVTTREESHGWESAKKRGLHIPTWKKPDGNGGWEVFETSDGERVPEDELKWIRELLTSDFLTQFDGVMFDSGLLNYIFMHTSEYTSAGYQKGDVLNFMYATFKGWCEDLRDKGVHVIVTMPYYVNSAGTFTPSIIGQTGPYMAGLWPYRMYVERVEGGKSVWKTDVTVNKGSTMKDGTNLQHKVVGCRLGAYPAEPLNNTPASLENLFKYIEFQDKKQAE